MAPIVIDYNTHVRRLTESVIYYGQTVLTITETLRDANVPFQVVVDESFQPPNSSASIFEDTPANTISDLYDHDDEEDGFERLAYSAETKEPAPKSTVRLTSEAVQQLHALRTIIDGKMQQRGYHKATTGGSKPPAADKKVCRFCTGPHDTESCMQRGEAF
jgi:hypothetical protein